MRTIFIFCFSWMSLCFTYGQLDSLWVEPTSLPVTTFNYLHPDELLIGKFAGTWVTQASGAPGSDYSIRVRGSGSVFGGAEPLYVINGIPHYNTANNSDHIYGSGVDFLSLIDPSNIKEIKVLSNVVATAQYGSRGANGVILIETKDGANEPFSVDIQTFTGYQNTYKLPILLDGGGFAAYQNDVGANEGNDPIYTNPSNFGKGSDWQQQLYSEAALIQNYRINLNVSNNNTSFSMLGSYLNQSGIVNHSGLKRYNLQARLASQPNDRLSFSSSMVLARSESNSVLTDDPDGFGVVTGAYLFSPLLGSSDILNYQVDNDGLPMNGNDGRSLNLLSSHKILNPIALSQYASSFSTISRLFWSSHISYDITDRLTFYTQLGVDGIFNEDFSYFGSVLQPELSVGGIGMNAKQQSFNWFNQSYLSYQVTHGSNVLKAKIGTEIQGTLVELLSGQSRGFDNEKLGYYALGSGATKTIGSSLDEVQSFAAMANLDYNLRSTYDINLILRTDASSRFGGDFVFLPALGFNMDLKAAGVLSGADWISGANLYAGAGRVGNQQIPSYLRFSQLDQSVFYLGNTELKSFVPTRIASDQLQMEISNQFDLGGDFVVRNGFMGSLEYYNRTTINAFIEMPMPYYNGVASLVTNSGVIRNAGIEMTAGFKNQVGKFDWNVNANIAFNSGKVISEGSSQILYGTGVYGMNDWLIFDEGEAIGAIYGFEINGMVTTAGADIATLDGEVAKAGTISYKDQNEDGLIDHSDRVVLGSVTPDLIYGFSTNMSRYGFDLSLLFQGVAGNEIVNFNKVILNNMNGTGNISEEAYENMWRATNQQGDLPISTPNDGKIVDQSLVENGSYLRLKYFSIGYNLPKSLLEKIKVQGINIFISGNNIFTLTKYSGMNPDVSLFNSEAQNMGADFGGYPSSKLWSVGFKIGL